MTEQPQDAPGFEPEEAVDADVDATRVVPRAAVAPSVSPDPETETDVEDATVVVSQRPESDDATIVVSRPDAAPSVTVEPEPEEPVDATVVVSRRPENEDATIFVARPQQDDDTSTADDDRTRFVHRDQRLAESTESQSSTLSRELSGPVAPPIPEPDYGTSDLGATVSLETAKALPDVYGARPWAPEPERNPRDDLVHARIGPAPVGSPSPEIVERPALPSFAKRTRRANAITLAAFGASIVVAVAGLWWIGTIVFG